MINETVTTTVSNIDVTGIIIGEIIWGVIFFSIGVFSTRTVKEIQHALSISAIFAIIIPIMVVLAQIKNGLFGIDDLGGFLLLMIFTFLTMLIGNRVGDFVISFLKEIYDFFSNLRD